MRTKTYYHEVYEKEFSKYNTVKSRYLEVDGTIFSSPIYKIGGLMLSPRRRRWRRRRRCRLNLCMQGLFLKMLCVMLPNTYSESLNDLTCQVS